MANLTKRERLIVDCWNRLEDDVISTERLLAMIEDETGAEVDEIIDAMIKTGEFQPAGASHE